MDANDNPVEASASPGNTPLPRSDPPRYRLIFASALGLALGCIITILVIQIMEFTFYRAPESAWPGGVGGPASPMSTPSPGITPLTPTPAPTTPPPGLQREDAAMAVQPLASNVLSAAEATTPTVVQPSEAPVAVPTASSNAASVADLTPPAAGSALSSTDLKLVSTAGTSPTVSTIVPSPLPALPAASTSTPSLPPVSITATEPVPVTAVSPASNAPVPKAQNDSESDE